MAFRGAVLGNMADPSTARALYNGHHRGSHYGLSANGGRAESLTRACRLLAMSTPDGEAGGNDTTDATSRPCSPIPARAAAAA
jgi:hypothetical protein